MPERAKQTFLVNKNMKTFLDDFKWENRVSKSKLMRRILKFLMENPEELEKINKNQKEKEKDK